MTGALVFALMACAQRPQMLVPSEIDQLVWYVEDVAHGVQRDYRELRLREASHAMDMVAQWAVGDLRDGEQVSHPAPLAPRRQRWPLLAQGLAAGLVQITPEGHLKYVSSSGGSGDSSDTTALPRQLRQALPHAVRRENLDRAATLDMLLGLGGVRETTQRRRQMINTFHAVRLHHASAAGGQQWSEPSPSTSPDEPTPSTSPQAPSPRRQP
ncbi:MAG: hypothetical protein EA401_14485 [Planctomycetota bacterium]|nr:MAG: hypothetical protein EA401_14485 [Planctomycetota bacterium]